MDTLTKDLLSGDRRALARAISLVENGGPQATQLVKKLYPQSGRAHLIGVTGSPGVGKSTLVDALITQMRKANLKVGVLAVDPSSPFTGGAILGDRIRMQAHTLDRSVFIRSMANRGHSGGIAMGTYDAVRMLEASGYDVVIIETVGVGQSELAIAQAADTTILVLMPGSGDDVQAIKSGIMEIGDIFVVNKADLPGANRTATDIMASLELTTFANDWRPPVLSCVAETNEGVDQVWEAAKQHRDFLQTSGELKQRRKMKVQAELAELVAGMARESLKTALETPGENQKMLSQVVEHEVDPHSAAETLAKHLFGRSANQ